MIVYNNEDFFKGYAILKVISNVYNKEKIGDLYNLFVEEKYRGTKLDIKVGQ